MFLPGESRMWEPASPLWGPESDMTSERYVTPATCGWHLEIQHTAQGLDDMKVCLSEWNAVPDGNTGRTTSLSPSG